MLTVSEALALVLEHSPAKQPAQVPLLQSLGLVLAQDVASDVDSPPHDKSMVDGYALQSADLMNGTAEFELLEEITAGNLPTKSVIAGTCSRIMTGAPIPAGADAVVMVEQSQLSGRMVRLKDERIQPGQHIMRRGTSLRRGETVLRSGVEIGPAAIGLLAEVGCADVNAIPRATMAVLSTGNELVAADCIPGPSQIRNSNGPLLIAAAKQAGANPIDLGIARDDAGELRNKIREGFESDILVISGGVSAGVLDLVPKVLSELGVQQVFHKIRMKPGKPLWFGVLKAEWEIQESAGRRQETRANDALHSPFPIPQSPLVSSSPHAPRSSTLVFGLPGNPVSSLVCFELFVKPAIARLSGRPWEPPHLMRSAKLSREFEHRGDRPTYHPGVVVTSLEGEVVEPMPWRGSADLRGFVGANGLIVFPAGDRCYQPGDAVDVLRL